MGRDDTTMQHPKHRMGQPTCKTAISSRFLQIITEHTQCPSWHAELSESADREN
ncbi:MAG: hypothetical protein R3B46_13870 [Phycisphaerales bacterium]